MVSMTRKTWDLGWDLARGNQTIDGIITDYIKQKYDAVTCPITKLKDELRFQHLLAVGGSGCGKSTFFQQLMKGDLARAKKGKCTVISIDPVQANDLIIRHAGVEKYKNAILIDVSDPSSLPCLDMFETSATRDHRLKTSNLIGVFKDVCGGLMDSALTQPMRTLFSYCAKAVVHMERCDLRQLLQLLTTPLEVLQSIGVEVTDPTYEFFLNEVVGTGKGRTPMRETATALRSRVHSVLGDPIIERLFCAGPPTLSLSKAINEGAMIFVCTRKGDLTQDGARLLGNYILTLTHRTMQERVSMDPKDMMPCFLYYDEFQNALSGGYNEILAAMLDENRKYKLGVHLATTRFGHINTDMGDAILSCSESKLIGKMATRGAAAIATELFGGGGSGVDKLTGLGNYKFYCRVKSIHKEAVLIGTTPDPIKKMGKENVHAMKIFRERMSIKYGDIRMEMEKLSNESEPLAVVETTEEPISTVGSHERTPLDYVAAL